MEIEALIQEGEHLQLDFKFAVNEARKIAYSLCAFANAQGGRLLIGVKDNGKIAGVRSEEELYMIDTAADLYTHPVIPFETNLWNVGGKKVLEVIVQPGIEKPYMVKDENDRFWAYVRFEDQNIKASPVHLELWKNPKQPKVLNLGESEERVIQILRDFKPIGINRLARESKTDRRELIRFLARLCAWEIVEFMPHQGRFQFKMIEP